MNFSAKIRTALAALAVFAIGVAVAPIDSATAVKVTPAAVEQGGPTTFVSLADPAEATLVPSGVLSIVYPQIVEDQRGWFNEISKISVPTANVPVTGGNWNPAGVYLVTFDVEFSANSSGRRLILIRKNGASPYVGQVSVQAVTLSGASTHVQTTEAIRLEKGDYVEFFTKHDTNVPTQLNIKSKITFTGPIAL